MFVARRLLCLHHHQHKARTPSRAPAPSATTLPPPRSDLTVAARYGSRPSPVFSSISRTFHPRANAHSGTIHQTACSGKFVLSHRLDASVCRAWPPRPIHTSVQEQQRLSHFSTRGDACRAPAARLWQYAVSKFRVSWKSVAEQLGFSPSWNDANAHKVLGPLLKGKGHFSGTKPSRSGTTSYYGMIVRALSFSCTRSHACLGVMALIFGIIDRPICEAQGTTSFYSQSAGSPSHVISFLLAALEMMGLFARTIFLLILFTPAVLSAPFANAFGDSFRQSWLQLVHHTLEFAGAAFIKWGQWAATRPDLFPRDLCAELTKLHTKAPAHSFNHTVQTVETAFGQKLHDIFEDFEEVPVASGSIAQVHRATLRAVHGYKQKPMVVAVKVRHPGVSDIIRRDFVIIKWIANLSTLIPGISWLRLDESVRQFAVFMLTQVDLAREATHLSRFLYNFRSWRDVSFPRPVYPFVHPAVLVESFEQGQSISRFVELTEKSRINHSLAHIGTNTLLKMLLVDNFIHADMHPGNILVRVENGRTPPGMGLFRSRPHVVFLDVGLTAELSHNDRVNLLEFFKAVAVRDGKAAAECTLKFSRDQSCPNPAAFISEVATSFKFWESKEADVISPGECMHDLLEQVRRHRVNVDGDVCTVMVTIMVLEGWQRKLDPDYRIMNTLQSLLFKVDMVESLSYTMTGIMAP